MNFSDIPAAVISAWTGLINAIAALLILIISFITNRRVKKVEEQSDGITRHIENLAEKRGHKEGVEHATAAAERTAATLAKGQAEGRAEWQARKDKPS